jgi:hypothetical protein
VRPRPAGPGRLVRSLLPQPIHHTKASNVVDVDGLESEEAEIGEVNPVAAILVASQVVLPNASYSCSGTASTLPIRVARSDPSASPSAPTWPTNRLHRGSVFRFWVCMAILQMRKMGRPVESSAKGIREPKGNPACLRKSSIGCQPRLVT